MPKPTETEAPMQIVNSSGGAQIALHDFGGEGKPLIICHATGFNATAYRPLLPHLAKHFHVFALDFRGHGASSAPDDNDYSWSRTADDLLAVIDQLGSTSVHAIGHSMGATTIMLAEQRRPGTIAAAWLFEPIVFPDDLAPRNSMMAAAARKRRAVFESRELALMRYASRPPLGTCRADALAGYVAGGFRDLDDGTVRLACDPETEAAIFEGATTYTRDVSAFTVPTLVASGTTTDEPGPGEWAAAIAAALPNARHVAYEDLTHFGPFQMPDLLARDAAGFLQNAG